MALPVADVFVARERLRGSKSHVAISIETPHHFKDNAGQLEPFSAARLRGASICNGAAAEPSMDKVTGPICQGMI